jgi:membrane protein DedA with SNARE-associated domain
MDAVTDFVLGLVSSPFIYLVVFALVVIDGFFPPVPSESVIVVVASLAVSSGAPNLWLILGIAAVGAAVGDNIAFWIGSRIGTERFAWMRRPRVRRGIERATRGLDRSAAALILTARYIPVGRIAVNMTAGATGFRWRRFWPLTVAAGIMWAIYSVVIGVASGAWLHDHPLIAAVVGIAIAIAIGFAIDRITIAVLRRRRARSARAQDATTVRPAVSTLEE